MIIRSSHNKEELAAFFRRSPGIYLYLIGDLDDKFWNNCTWYSLSDDTGAIKAVALLFRLFDPPTFIAMSDDNDKDVIDLVNAISPQIPSRLYGHLSVGLLSQLTHIRVAKDHGEYQRMILEKTPVLYQDSNIRSLTTDDVSMIEEFYKVAYPVNWFDISMLIKGRYMGYFDSGRLVAVSGTHIFSPEYGVSALGNIATHPDYRGRGIGEKLTSNLCYELAEHTDIIGLNVKAANSAAIRTYEKVGFKMLSAFDECEVDIN